MEVTIESRGLLFFRKIVLKADSTPFATIHFTLSFFQNAVIKLHNAIWIFKETGLIHTAQKIIDSKTGEVLVNRNLSTLQQLKELFFMGSAPLITVAVREDTYTLKKIPHTQNYLWFKNDTTTNLGYDATDLVSSQTKVFPRLRALWKLRGTLPENQSDLSLALFFLGTIELINKIKLSYQD